MPNRAAACLDIFYALPSDIFKAVFLPSKLNPKILPTSLLVLDKGEANSPTLHRKDFKQ